MTESSPLATHGSLPGSRRRQWLLLAGLFLLSLPAVTTRIYSSDEIQYFAYLRSLWFDRDLSFQNEYQYFYDRGIAKSEGFRETFLERSTVTGRRINFATIGCAILWAPFYAVGDAVARVTGAPADGFSKPYVAAVAYASAVYGFFALVLAVLSARRLGLDGFGGALAIWLGTPLLFYMYVAPPFSHATSAFGVALFIYVWLRVRGDWSPRGMMALGGAAALMAMVREQDAFFVAGPALDFVSRHVSDVRRPTPDARRPTSDVRRPTPDVRRPTPDVRRPTSDVWGLLAAAVAFVAVYSLQAAAYLVLNGHIGPHSSVGRKMNWMAPHALQVLFSPEHGFLFWTPLALLALAGLLFLRDRRIAACLALMFALQIYVGGAVESWTLAGAFGQRRLIALTAVLVIGFAALHARTRGWTRRLMVGVAALAVYWNLALTAEFAVGLMDRQRLEPAKNAYDAFVTLPRMAPDLIYRYLFDRTSFYKPPT